jgi:hypothetical protein
MDKLIELLQQIQDLAGVAIDALQGAAGDAEKKDKPEGKPEGGPPEEGGKPPEGGPPPGGGEGGPPPERR